MQQTVSIRLLTEEDWILWKRIRLEALAESPTAFFTTCEEEALRTDESFQQGLVRNKLWGAFAQGHIVGMVGFYVMRSSRTAHRGVLCSLYLQPAYRHQGIADRLVETVLRVARRQVMQVHCTVVTENQPAVQLYQKHGFRIYGTEECALNIDGQLYDLYMMVHRFTDLDE